MSKLDEAFLDYLSYLAFMAAQLPWGFGPFSLVKAIDKALRPLHQAQGGVQDGGGHPLKPSGDLGKIPGENNRHLHGRDDKRQVALPADTRLLNSPEYALFSWICI
jgi:hypothetical protein